MKTKAIDKSDKRKSIDTEAVVRAFKVGLDMTYLAYVFAITPREASDIVRGWMLRQ